MATARPRWVSATVVCAALAVLPQTAGGSMLSRTLGLNGVPSYDEKVAQPWMAQIETEGKLPKAMYEPPAEILAPYAKATLGPDVAYSIVNNVYFVRAPEAQKLCQRIVEKLLEAWPGPKHPVRVMIRDEPYYGAQSNWAGDIVVSIGTFHEKPDKGVQSEDELALMLAHELAHLFLPHLQSQQSFKSATDTLSFAASTYLAVAAFKNSKSVDGKITVAADNRMVTQAMVGGMASTILVGDLFAPSWGRSDEREADRLGLDLARRAGFVVNQDEIIQFIGKHGDEMAKRTERMKRAEALADLAVLAANTQSTGKGDASDVASLLVKLIGTKLIAEGFQKISEWTTAHPDKESRKADLLAYFHTAYNDVEVKGKRKTAELKKVVKHAGIRQALKSTQAAATIEAMIFEHTENSAKTPASKPATGMASGAPAVAAPPAVPLPSACGSPATVVKTISVNINFPVDTAPRTWQIRGDWQNLTPECRPRAKNDWMRNAQSDYASMDVLQNLAMQYSRTPNARLLPLLYKRYKTLYGTDEPFPALAVAAAVAENNMAVAEQRAAQCYVYEQHSHYLVCSDLLGYNPLAKGETAKTPEGKKAFADAAAKGGISDLFGGAGLFK